ncbi:MAG: hypothetical protein OEY11_15010 [Gammaproteobacteria bacterium]|nr:hypothetical protein [Gammaproteobacteria bacterium]
MFSTTLFSWVIRFACVLFIFNSNSLYAIEAVSNKAQSRGMDIGLTALFSAGGSSVDNLTLSDLQAGGHDPARNGFTVQNVELSIAATIDSYFDAQSNFIFLINAEGETVVELEEAFLTTRQLAAGLQLKAGQYFTEFGRQNSLHPHSWSFADQPVILSRLLGGDGLRSQGLRLSWLMPTDWFSELLIGAQNAKGETAQSFLNAAGEDVAGYILIDRRARNSGDLLYSARWLNAADISDTISMNVGVSGLWGPNASDTESDTTIIGSDFYIKWQAINSQRGYPFVAWHSEIVQREYEALNQTNPAHEILVDSGYFSQISWGFKPGWVAGLRIEEARSEGDNSTDPMRDNRQRLSTNITWYLSEYSKLRLQYNQDKTEHLADETAHSIWLQLEFNMGSHAAHSF